MVNRVIEGKNRYCGPAVLAKLMNITTDTAAMLIRRRSNQTRVTWARTSDIAAVINAYNGKLQHNFDMEGRSCLEIAKGAPLTLLVVRTSGGGSHFMMASKGKLFDNHSKQWVKAKDHINRYAVVKSALVIIKKPRKNKLKIAEDKFYVRSVMNSYKYSAWYD